MPTDPKYSALEKTLNTDHNLRAAFVKDPATVLKQQGIELTPQAVSAIHSQIAALKIPERPTPQFHWPHIHINIVISISAD